jgi:hypothetical protein
MPCSHILSEAVLNLNYKQRQYNNDSIPCSHILSEAVLNLNYKQGQYNNDSIPRSHILSEHNSYKNCRIKMMV